MAQQDVGAAFAAIAGQMQAVSRALGTQGVSGVVDSYEGESSKFREWIRNLEKYALLVGADDETRKRIAYQTSKGGVSDFLHRYMRDHPQSTWDEVREELADRFSEVRDRQHALALLRASKQKPRETVQLYAERIRSLAEDAFPPVAAGNREARAAVDRQLVEILTDGLREDSLKRKILRENPVTFNAAVTVAVAEQNVLHRFSLKLGPTARAIHRDTQSRREEPMEIDHSRPLRCFKCGGPHRKRDCPKLRINAVEQPSPPRPPIQCWTCGGPHFRRDCPRRLPPKNGQRLH